MTPVRRAEPLASPRNLLLRPAVVVVILTAVTDSVFTRIYSVCRRSLFGDHHAQPVCAALVIPLEDPLRS